MVTPLVFVNLNDCIWHANFLYDLMSNVVDKN
jgi:hypothetical protein